MKAVAALGPGVLDLVTLPVPQIGEYECLTQIAYSGICNGTDLKLLHNRVMNKTIDYPTVLGHEGVGVIVETGRRVRNWKVGDRVVSPIGTVAPETGFRCHYGQMAEYGVTHDIQAMMEDGVPLGNQPPIPDYRGKLIPDGMRFADAVMLLTFKENYSALQNFGFRAGMDLLICGDGPVSMGIARIARALGARRLAVAGHHDSRLEHIGRCVEVDRLLNTAREPISQGLADFRADMVIDAVGSLALAREAAQLLRPGGVVGLYGVITDPKANINLFDFPNDTALHILNWPYGEHRAHEAVVELVRRGVLVPSQYYSHILPMTDVRRGFEMVASREAFKVILRMPAADGLEGA